MSGVGRYATVVIIAMISLSGVSSAGSGAEATPPEAALRKTSAGWYITNNYGMTLYTFDSDASTPGQSACGEKCVVAWPPLLAGNKARPVGEWSLVTRSGDLKQWAFRGMPLYTYARDSYPSANFGDNEAGLWHVAFQPVSTPPQFSVVNYPHLGRILADARGAPVYFREGKDCDQHCRQDWKPVMAPWLAKGYGVWSVVDHNDGSKLWAYRNHPLYTSHLDVTAGDAKGDGAGGWHAVVMEPAPHLPKWATVQNSDMGPIIADARGMTVYVFSGNMEKVESIACDSACVKDKWRPLAAESSDEYVGNWAVAANDDGTLQWTFKGDRVYTFNQDAQPGDIAGDKFAHGHGKLPRSGGWWRTILSACLCSIPASQ